MKQISRLLLLSIFLASCGNSVTMVPPNIDTGAVSTNTPAPKDTATPRPTSTREATATAVDPNAPTDATGKDKAGNYIKPWLDADGNPVKNENGQPLNLTWVSILVGPEGEAINMWVENHIKNPTFKGGIPSIDQPREGWVIEPTMPIYFLVKDGINAPFLEHTPDKTPYNKEQTYSGTVSKLLRERFTGKSNGKYGVDPKTTDYYDNFPNISISLVDAQGHEHTLKINEASFTIILVDPADIPNPDWTIPNRSGPATSILSMALYDDATHSVTILVANTKPMDQLSDQDFMDTILRPYGYALLLPYQTQEALSADTSFHPSPTSFANMALKGDPPYFTLSDSP